MTKEIQDLHDKLDRLQINCIPHLQTDIAELKTDVSWLKKNQWLILTTALSSLIGIIFILVRG